MTKKLVIFPIMLMVMVFGCGDSGTTNEISTKELEAKIFSLELDNKQMVKCVIGIFASSHNHSHLHSHELIMSQTMPSSLNNYESESYVSGIKSNENRYRISDTNAQGCADYINRIDDRLGK